MSNEISLQENQEIIQKLVLDGDLSKMNAAQRVTYYNKICSSLGLNPFTTPFQIIKLQGKEKLYATKDCTEQLRKIHGVSITDISTTNLNGVFIVTAKAQDKTGKTDCSTGAVSIEGLKGDNLANAIMKAETKAKRRVTLSICGLGILDESETDTIKTEDITPVEVTTVQNQLPASQPPVITPQATPEQPAVIELTDYELQVITDLASKCETTTTLTNTFTSLEQRKRDNQKVRDIFNARREEIKNIKALQIT